MRATRFFHPAVMLACAMFLLSASVAFADVCDTYSETLSEKDIVVLRGRLRDVMPSRDADLIDRVVIKNVAADDAMMPSAVTPLDGSPAWIEVPRGFRRRQCRMILWSGALLGKAPELVAPEVDRLARAKSLCLRTRGPAECFDAMLQGAGDFRTPTGSDGKGGEPMSGLIEGAFLHVLAHEMGHVIFRNAVGGAARAFSADEEVRADYLAQMAVIWSGGDYRGMIYMMVPLAFFADVSPPSEADDHASAKCRAYLTALISEKFAPEFEVAFHWGAMWPMAGMTGQTPGGSLMADAAMLRDRMNVGSSFGRSSARFCPPVSFRRLDGVRAGSDRLLGAIDAASGLASESDRVAALLKYDPGTPDLRAVLGALVVYRLAALDRRAEERGDVEQRRVLAQLLRRVSTRFDLNTLNGQAVGLLFLHLGNGTFELAPKGADLAETVRSATADLKRAERFVPKWASLYDRLETLAMLEGDCKEAGRRSKQAAEAGPASAAAQPFSSILLKDDLMCSVTSEMLRDRYREKYGWR